MNAIPTMYNGIQFRSRLEANWAAFFDLLGWDWEYEPIDLAGYIPDFVIHAKKENFIVEIKPPREIEELIKIRHKIRASGWKEDFVICSYPPTVFEKAVDYDYEPLGASLFWGMHCEGIKKRGYISGDYIFSCSWCAKSNPLFLEKCISCGKCMTFFCADKKPKFTKNADAPQLEPDSEEWYCFGRTQPDHGLLLSMWATAKNRVQWKGQFDQ